MSSSFHVFWVVRNLGPRFLCFCVCVCVSAIRQQTPRVFKYFWAVQKQNPVVFVGLRRPGSKIVVFVFLHLGLDPGF